MQQVASVGLRLVIDEGLSYKVKGKDGIVGEGIDVIICVLDLIRKTYPNITESELEAIADNKLAKWVNNVSGVAK